jgi:hypothetical protein
MGSDLESCFRSSASLAIITFESMAANCKMCISEECIDRLDNSRLYPLLFSFNIRRFTSANISFFRSSGDLLYFWDFAARFWGTHRFSPLNVNIIVLSSSVAVIYELCATDFDDQSIFYH